MAQEQPPQPTKADILRRIEQMERENQEHLRALERELGTESGPSVTSPEPTPEPTPTTPEEVAIQKEIENMPEADRERLGWGLSTIGYKVEKMKNDLFAGALASAAKKADKKGTFGRFVNELRNTFVRDAEEAEKKGMAIKTGSDGSKLSQLRNLSLLTGNVLKYGRVVADLCGVSIANPFRYVMMGGMIAARGAEAGKEARFKSDELLEKTQIQDAEKAAEEAWKIYEKAGGKIGTVKEGKTNEFGNLVYDEDTASKNLSAEALKNAYLVEMPADIQERLKNPTAAYNFVEAITRKEIELSLGNLERKMNWVGYSKIKKDIDGNDLKILSDEQIEIEKQKLLKKYEKRLMDYDRMVTQYGTVDQLAMLGRNVQLVAKGVVLGMQLQTGYKLLTNVPRLYEHLSQIFSHHNIHPIDAVGNFIKHNPFQRKTLDLKGPKAPGLPADYDKLSVSRPVPPETLSGLTTPPEPDVPETSAAPLEAHVDLSSNGFTQTIFDLKHKLIEQYGSPDKMPANVKAFYDTPSTKLSQEYGFWDTEKGTSGMGYHGEKLSIDADGHLKLEHLGGKSEIIDTEHKFGGKMFTPEKVAPAPKAPETYAPGNNPTIKDILKPATGQDMPPPPIEHPAEHVAHLKAPEPAHTPAPTEKNLQETERIKRELLEKMAKGKAAQVDDLNRPGVTVTSRGEGGSNYIYNSNPSGVRLGIQGGYMGPTPGESSFLQHHMDFVDKNPFHLSGEELMKTYEEHKRNLAQIFKNNEHGMDLWEKLKGSQARGLIETKNPDPNDRLLTYVQKLHTETHLPPKGGIIRPPETTEHYIARALQWLEKRDKLDKVKVE